MNGTMEGHVARAVEGNSEMKISKVAPPEGR